ncbi:NUDIX hydrolase [Aquihabitans sp. McL0605]|uniref:NUDIX hydrolase n=1 Tax=Aquihabitans sp. McL0605 TaxID=3415671 RepID=UPI003CE96085
MRDQLHLSLLRTYQRLPTWARRRAVRTVAPSYTVGAMCFIERDDDHLLLVRHVYRKRWGVPGGLLKRGEDAADGARREVLEEVGLAIDLIGEAQVVVDAEPQRVDVIYRAKPVADADLDSVAPGSPEILEARWFPRDALPELQHETVTALLTLARAQGINR